jgi:hypothetical protein
MGVEADPIAGQTSARVRYGRLVLGGIVAGAVVFGLGSRVAMRLVGIFASPHHLGEPTAFGVVGKITLAGVATLVIMGCIAGLFSGLLYLAVRPWLPGAWVARGLSLGLLLLTPVGVFIVASSKSDFDLVSPTLILGLFAAMILVEGLATAWVIERLGRGSLPPPRPRALGYVVFGTIASIGFAALGASVSEVL